MCGAVSYATRLLCLLTLRVVVIDDHAQGNILLSSFSPACGARSEPSQDTCDRHYQVRGVAVSTLPSPSL